MEKRNKGLVFKKIYSLVSCVPQGKVTTYGEIARYLGLSDARIVGWALHANKSLKIPCHRVVDRKGRLARGYAFGGWQKQRKKLLQEGVAFKNSDIVDLTKCLFCFGDSNRQNKS